MKAKPIKNMQDVKTEMGELYARLKAKQVDVKTAAELANIAGKFLKAEQLELAREIFERHISGIGTGPATEPKRLPRLN